MRAFAMMLVGLALAGCSSWAATPEAKPFDVTVTHERPAVPDECSPTSDPKWKNLDDADVPRSEAARNYKANKDKFKQLAGKRSICGDALKAHGML
jgi:hypothetical protein